MSPVLIDVLQLPKEGDDIIEVGERALCHLVSALGENDGLVHAVEGGDAELQLTDLNLEHAGLGGLVHLDLEGSGGLIEYTHSELFFAFIILTRV